MATKAKNQKVQSNHVVTLHEAPHKRAMCEKKMRYEVHLNGKFFSDLYFNMKGYVGSLPLPGGSSLSIGECAISAYKKEIGTINRAAREAAAAVEEMVTI